MRVAQELLHPRAGRPAHAFLRRSISTSYYAAFAALGDQIAAPYGEGTRPAVRRLLQHGLARDVCETIGRGSVPWLPDNPDCHDDLGQFAEDFVALFLARRRADYDFAYEPTLSDAEVATQRGERAIDALDKAASRCAEQLEVMCVAMIAPEAVRIRMKR